MYNGILYYFVEPISIDELDKEKLLKIAKGFILLNEYTFRIANETLTNYKFCFYLQGNKKEFFIRAENQQDFDDWCNLLSLMVINF